MKVGDLVMKRWGRIEPHQQNTVGLVVGFHNMKPHENHQNPMLTGQWVLIAYPGSRAFRYREQEFEVVSEKL